MKFTMLPGSTEKEIERAYREMARKVHPDHNTSPTATAEFQELSAQYQRLKEMAQNNNGILPNTIEDVEVPYKASSANPSYATTAKQRTFGLSPTTNTMTVKENVEIQSHKFNVSFTQESSNEQRWAAIFGLVNNQKPMPPVGIAQDLTVDGTNIGSVTYLGLFKKIVEVVKEISPKKQQSTEAISSTPAKSITMTSSAA